MSATALQPPEDLDAVEAQLWSLLAAGAQDPRAPFHDGVIGTIAADGPNLRTVILRGADPVARRLRFHTDIRSPKYAELAIDARLAWTFYDPSLRLQMRLWGAAGLHHDDALADAQWLATPMNSRRIYHAVAAPGSVSAAASSGLPPELDDARWTQAFSERARPNFTVVETLVTRLEGLYLHHDGHRRMRFVYDADGQRAAADWLVP